MKKFISILLLCATVITMFASCEGEKPSETTGDETTVSPPESTTAEVTTEEATTEEVTTEEPMDTTPFKIEVNWNVGYVGSSTNPYGYANKLNPGGGAYSYTDVIEIAHKGTKIVIKDTKKGSSSGNCYVISSWKRSGNDWEIDLDGINIPGGGKYVIETESDAVVYTYITSVDNECIRFCYRSNSTSVNANDHPEFVAQRTNEPGTYAPVLKEKQDYLDFMEAEKKRDYQKILEGLTMNVIGDSYFHGQGLDAKYVWPAMVATKYGMTFDNKGIGGSTISNYVTTNNPMVDRYNNMPNNNPNIVIIEGGRNDYNKSVPIGKNDDTSTKTFKGAVNYFIDKVRNKYPNALILAVSPWEVGGSKNSAGYYCSDYALALIEICNLNNVPVFDARDQKKTGVYMTDPAFRSQYCIGPNDISHLNLYGMMKVAPVFEKWIAEEYTRFKK